MTGSIFSDCAPETFTWFHALLSNEIMLKLPWEISSSCWATMTKDHTTCKASQLLASQDELMYLVYLCPCGFKSILVHFNFSEISKFMSCFHPQLSPTFYLRLPKILPLVIIAWSQGTLCLPLHMNYKPGRRLGRFIDLVIAQHEYLNSIFRRNPKWCWTLRLKFLSLLTEIFRTLEVWDCRNPFTKSIAFHMTFLQSDVRYITINAWQCGRCTYCSWKYN